MEVCMFNTYFTTYYLANGGSHITGIVLALQGDDIRNVLE